MSSPARREASSPSLEVRRGDWMVLLSALCFSTMPIFGSTAYEAGIGVVPLLAWRFLLSVSILATVLAVSRRLHPVPKRKLASLFGMGGMYFVMSFLYFNALKVAPISTLALLFYTYPAIVTLLAAALLRERISRVKATALALALAGCLLVLRPSELGSGRGAAFALVASGMYSGFLLWGTEVMRGTDVVLATTLILSVCAIGYGALALWRGELAAPVGFAAWGPILGIAAVSTVLSDVFFFWGLPRTGASRAAILSTLEPVCTLALSGLFLGEAIPAVRLLGGALILASVVLIHRE